MGISRSLAAFGILLVALTASCTTLSHPPMSRADVQTTDPGPHFLVSAWSPIGAYYATVVDPAVDATGLPGDWSKEGRATCRNILGLVAVGDASITAASKAAGITKIHHVGAESVRAWFFYSQYTTVVYGD